MQTPASIVFFDLLSSGARDLRNEPFKLRRVLLEEAFVLIQEADRLLASTEGDTRR